MKHRFTAYQLPKTCVVLDKQTGLATKLIPPAIARHAAKRLNIAPMAALDLHQWATPQDLALPPVEQWTKL